MRATTDPILVVGATGMQGGAVADRLLDEGREVRALTRERSRAADLEARGAQVAEGELTDRPSLERALEGVAGVYGMTTPFEAGMEAEVEQGTTLVDAVAEAGVSHLVFSSVASADRDTGIPHFETKREIERHIEETGVPATILRPVFFMENFQREPTWSSIADEGVLAMPMDPETPLQMVALADHAGIAAAAFADPDRFLGETIETASDERTMPEVAAALSDELGREIDYRPVPLEAVEERMGEDMARMFEWFHEVGYDVDIEALEEKWGIPLTPLEVWAASTDWPA
ncbi:MAG: NmrA/HSCARG family protein [Gemmatimonadota bacterium]|nr:NmrA/HSCARG family protein [Gemmatimonadota bacterium]